MSARIPFCFPGHDPLCLPSFSFLSMPFFTCMSGGIYIDHVPSAGVGLHVLVRVRMFLVWLRARTCYVRIRVISVCSSLSRSLQMPPSLIGKSNQGLHIRLLALVHPSVVSMSAQHLSGGDDFGVEKRQKKKVQKKATQRRHMLCMKKGKDARHAVHEPTNAQMLYFFRQESLRNIPKPPPSRVLSFSLSLRLQSALWAGIRILKNRVLGEGMKVVYKKKVSRPCRVIPHHYSYATGGYTKGDGWCGGRETRRCRMVSASWSSSKCIHPAPGCLSCLSL